MSILSKRSEVLANATAKSAAADAKKGLKNAANEAGFSKDDIVDIATMAGERVRGLISTTSAEIEETTENVAESIRSKPLQSALIALGAGFLLGLIARR